jgi:hypothetical protein
MLNFESQIGHSISSFCFDITVLSDKTGQSI